jgi:ribose transport system ATP-binding protein
MITGSRRKDAPIADAVEAEPALQLAGVSKRYGVVQAVADVSVDCHAGEIHAVVGENGSGKSTLLSIASGVTSPDAGTVLVGGQRLHGTSAHQARHLGIGMVFQTRSLAADMSVADNMFASVSARAQPARYVQRESWAQEQLARFNLAVDAGARTGDLNLSQQQMLEIVKAVLLEPKVLLLDEPTTALGPEQVDGMHDLLSRLLSEGMAVMYVSHRLTEILSVAQRVTVMRDGSSQGTYATSDVTEERLISLMVGPGRHVALDVKDAKREPRSAPLEADTRTLLTVEELSGHGFGPVTLAVRTGEIVGIAGADGNGQLELLEAIAGLRPSSGTISRGDSGPYQRNSPRAALDAGVMLLPGDRLGQSLVPALGIRSNATLNALNRFQRNGVLRPRQERQAVGGMMSRLKVRTPSLDQPVRLLSGGNQQKVVLARPFLRDVDVLLADEPSQGVDVQSRIEIYEALRSKVDEGSAVMVRSSDPVELTEVCDRVIVLSRGRVVRELHGEDINEHTIISAIVASAGYISADPGPVHEGNSNEARMETPEASSGGWDRPHADHHTDTSAEGRRSARLQKLLVAATPFALLALLTVTLFAYTGSRNAAFLGSFNLNSLLISTVPLALVAMAQTKALVAGGFDISVGLTATLALVLSSFFLATSGAGTVVTGVAVVLGAGVLVGLVNGLLVTRLAMPPIVATIATLSVLQGVTLLLRPVPAGTISFDVTRALGTSVSFVPVAFVVVLVMAVAADVVLHGTHRGLTTRFTGLDATSALRVGIPTKNVQLRSYVVAALLASIAGIFLGVLVGVGDPAVGSEYALLSVAAAVLGGASLTGGRGSYLGAVWAALFLTLIANASPFLDWDTAISRTATGALTLAALFLYSWGAAAAARKFSNRSSLPAPRQDRSTESPSQRTAWTRAKGRR